MTLSITASLLVRKPVVGACADQPCADALPDSFFVRAWRLGGSRAVMAPSQRHRAIRLVLLALLVPAASLCLSAQSGVIFGTVSDAESNEGVPFATVVLQGTTTGTSTDENGDFRIENLEPSLYNLSFSSVGYQTEAKYEIRAYNNRETRVDVALKPDVKVLESVEVKASPFNKTAESPVSLRTIGTEEIQRNPGGSRDISRVIQSLPGVSSTASFRNDILIRGGAPNENRFFLDGVEVPNINHFATQGSSGGPVGLINVDFIREVDFYAGAWPASRANALSSVFDFKMREGRTDRWGVTFTVGSSDIGATLEGPVGEKGNLLVSARRSYLQFLFQALELPFLPTYNGFQLRYKHNFDRDRSLTIVGLGAIDQFALNMDANETEDQQYLLSVLPVNEQWNYTLGAVYKRLYDGGYYNLVLSRNMLNNTATKYADNQTDDPSALLLDYRSQEMENRFRFENIYRFNGYKLDAGVRGAYVRYNNRTFNRVFGQTGPIEVNFSSELDFGIYGAYAQLSKSVWENRISLSAGFRVDGASYSAEMSRAWEQFSPRLSASWSFAPDWSLNANVGRYYQLPAYTVLGYRDSVGTLVNRQNGIDYIRSDQAVAGIEYNTAFNTRFTVEAFYKRYEQYPFLLRDSFALANLGADFGVIGNEPVAPIGEGRAYGVEFLAQQKIYKGFYGILAYTYVISEFKDASGTFVPSSWDNRHIISLTAGKRFPKNWELGVNYRFAGGLPFTPYDLETSSLIASYTVNNGGILDYDRLNSERLGPSQGFDFRLDKKWFFKKWNLNLYLDVENALNQQAEQVPFLVPVRDDNGNPVIDPEDPGRYVLRALDNPAGTVLPTLGIIVII